MFNFYYEDVNKWTIAMYEKRGRAYTEIGVFFEDEATRVEVFELFAEMCNALPTWQAVERALMVLDAGEEEVPAYEVRLMDSTNRVLATVLWDVESLKKCVEDYKSRNVSTYRLVAEVELDEGYDLEDIDWNVLEAQGKFRAFDITPTDVL